MDQNLPPTTPPADGAQRVQRPAIRPFDRLNMARMSEKLPGMPIIGNGSLFPQMPGGEGGAGGMFPGILGSILSGITSDPRLADAQGRIIERLQAALSRPGGRLAPTDTQQPPADGGSGNILQG